MLTGPFLSSPRTSSDASPARCEVSRAVLNWPESWRTGASDDSRGLRAQAAAVEADVKLHARGRGNAARAGVDPGRRYGRLPELRSLAATGGAKRQGPGSAAPGETH